MVMHVPAAEMAWARERHKLRTRVAEMEAACAAKDEALRPLAALTIWADNVVSTGIAPFHVLAARAALAMQTAPPTPEHPPHCGDSRRQRG
jgi:hypothetical protein